MTRPTAAPTAHRRLPQLLAATLVSVALTAGCSSGGGASGALADAAASGDAATGSTGSASGNKSQKTAAADLFDNTKVHDIEITYDQTAYQAMIAEFRSSGSKEWIEATVTVDGTTIKKAGIRLKGNSSLMGLRNAGNAGGGAAAGGAAPGGRVGGPGGNVSADAPNGLPWLVRLDKYVDGQNIKGTTEFVIRSNSSQTSLNEAVALELLGLTGQVTQRSFSTRFSVNGGAEKLRLAIENPGDDWEDDNFPNNGVLYKAESGGDYSYRGADAASYKDAFDQESDKDNENYAPLIAFLKFINESDDATFASQLGNYLDVESFARYLAGQVLVNNFDDIDGPGNNSYLRYDEKTKKMTIVSWDLNLAFGAIGGAGGAGGQFPGAGQLPADGQVPGGGQFPGGGQATGGRGQVPGGAPAGGGFTPPTGATGAFPGGAPAGGGFTPPTGATGAFPGGGQAPGGAGGAAGRGGFGGRTNILVTRFNANTQFKALYDKTLADMKASIYGTGQATTVLERWKKLLTAQAADLVPAATIESEASGIARNFTA